MSLVTTAGRIAALMLLGLIGLLAAGGSFAQDGDSATAMLKDAETGEDVDSFDYFLEATDREGHPWHRSSTEAEHGGKSPWTIWSGPRNSYLRGTLKAEIAYFDQDNSWFGEPEANLGRNSTDWWEAVVHPGVDGTYFLEDGGQFYARFSFLNSSTDGVDAAGSNLPRSKDSSHTSVEDAFVGWRSGNLFPALGKDFLDISFGSQQYKAGTGFLFYDEGSDGGNRGGYWIGERHNAEYAGIAKVKWHGLTADLVNFKANDNPNTDTKVTGTTIDYDLGNIGGVGGGFYHVESDIDTRDGMDVYDIRFEATPFAAFDTAEWLNPVSFDGEFVHEDNGDKLGADGWYLSAGYSWEHIAWKPAVTYRYASFEGNDPNSSKSQDFDPLYYGFYDWGYWFQGEILGEYVLLNSNLNSHTIRVSADPSDSVHINFFYYKFILDDASGFGVQSDDFADEIDFTIDWTVTDSFGLSIVGAYAKPDDGAKEYTGGNDDWTYGMLYATYSFD